jgi:hypothetical protein
MNFATPHVVTASRRRERASSAFLAASSRCESRAVPLRENLRLRRRLAERLERVRFRRRNLQRHVAWKERRNLLAGHITDMCRFLGLDGEAVEYVVVLVACDLDDFADEDAVGADDTPALLDLQPRDRISHARATLCAIGSNRVRPRRTRTPRRHPRRLRPVRRQDRQRRFGRRSQHGRRAALRRLGRRRWAEARAAVWRCANRVPARPRVIRTRRDSTLRGGYPLPRAIHARADSPFAHHAARDTAWRHGLRCDLLLSKQEVARQSRMGPKGAQATGQVIPGAPEHDRRHERRRAEAARGLVVYLIGEHARQQSVKLLLRQGCKLQKAGVQPLQLALRQRVEIDTTNTLLGARTLQPTKKNLSSARI